MDNPKIALVLGGGAARGLAHIGVLEALEREGICPCFVVGSSMGGLIAALWASGEGSAGIRALARGFSFPSWFIPGGIVTWDRVFRSAVPPLSGLSFTDLPRKFAVVAVDLESGRRVVLRDGLILPAVRATCAVPGVLPPIEIAGRWLVDGGLVSLLPVDIAVIANPDVIVAVNVKARPDRAMPALGRTLATISWTAGRLFPNPATARLAFELAVRATEIALERQVALASAMVGPDVLVEVDVGTVGLRDFSRLDDAAGAGCRAMEAAIPALRRALSRRRDPLRDTSDQLRVFAFDPVCDMVVDPSRAPTVLDASGRPFHFCSEGCKAAFVRGRVGGG